MKMRTYLLWGLFLAFGSLCADAMIDYQGKLMIEVLDEASGLPVPGYQFSVSEDYSHTKIIATVEAGIDGRGWSKKKLKPGEYYIFNSRTSSRGAEARPFRVKCRRSKRGEAPLLRRARHRIHRARAYPSRRP